MVINEFFPSRTNCLLAGAICLVFATYAERSATAQSYTAAPTPVYGSAESQSSIRFHGPGLPGAEAQQSVKAGSRHVLFDVAGYDGVIFAPVTPPYDAASTYRTYAGQPGRGATALLSQTVDGAP
ncbi:hypothetical protein NFI95_00510 [Acetobacteraceae bacterium KSS8]|uniref:Uncharacterized protein n=1 Tax=Endosaccharibacter trunci TaxID=2812733 RepID=A0ABT1W444_9PROT|nr:hypothetical protein [Acetobacteraceae bacterium KSS8]